MEKRSIVFLLVLAMAAFLSSCGGGGGSSSGSSGTISMNITDAKPALPVTGVVQSVSIEVNEVSVHKSGGGWTTLTLATHPYTIDLYQFSNGSSTQLAPAGPLESGKYTQVRLGVASGTITIDGEPHQLEIPSENLRTDKNFEFDVVGEGTVNLTVDFDLSQSIVVTGLGTYQLKPVLHIISTSDAAAIEGTIDFIGSSETVATVIVSTATEEYTKISVTDLDPSFRIYWLVPYQLYYVRVLLGDKTYEETVNPGSLPPGGTFPLNGDEDISPQ